MPDDKIDAFTNINPEDLAPELQAVYKNMQADYTRKTQDIASRRTEFETKQTDFEAKLQEMGRLQQENKQWIDWYQSLEDQSKSEGFDKDKLDLNTDVNFDASDSDTEMAKVFKTLQATIKSLETKIESTNEGIRQQGDQVNRMFNYQAQLNDLVRAHPDLDREKLLNHAINNNQTDLTKAYESLYADDIIEQRVKERLDVELAKRRTDGVNVSGHPLIVRAKNTTPKTFDEATEQTILERAAAGTLNRD